MLLELIPSLDGVFLFSGETPLLLSVDCLVLTP